MSTLHEQLHGKKYREENEVEESPSISRTRKIWGNSSRGGMNFRKIPNALRIVGNLWIFFLTLTFLLGLSSYVVTYFVVFHNLQVNWQLPSSGYLTQINSTDVDALRNQLAREGLDNGDYCMDQEDGTVKLKGNCKTLSDLATEERRSNKKKG